MIPKGWQLATLVEITDKPISYGIVQAGPHVPDGVPYLKSSDIGGHINVESLQRTCPSIHHKYRRSAVHPGDIVFSLRGNIAECSIVPSDLPEANLTQGTARIAVNAAHNAHFVRYQLSSTPIRNKISALSKGSTFREITLEDLRGVQIAMPLRREQDRIAEILSTWDKAIEATEELIANSQAQKKALMQKLLSGANRLPGFSEKWQRITLGDVGDAFGGLSGKSKNDFGAGKFYIQYKNVFDNPCTDLNKLDLVQIKAGERQETVQHGDILFTISSEVPHEVGMSSVVLNPPEGVYLNSFCFGFRQSAEPRILPEFAMHLFRGPEARALFTGMAQGSTRYNISKRQFLKSDFLIPPPEEQRAIGKIINNAVKTEQGLNSSLQALKSEKLALMQQLLTGKRRVKQITAKGEAA